MTQTVKAEPLFYGNDPNTNEPLTAGRTGALSSEAYIQNIEAAFAPDADEATKAKRLAQGLREKAKIWLDEELRVEYKSNAKYIALLANYDEFKKVLVARFYKVSTTSGFTRDFLDRKQKVGEPSVEYARRVYSMVNQIARLTNTELPQAPEFTLKPAAQALLEASDMTDANKRIFMAHMRDDAAEYQDEALNALSRVISRKILINGVRQASTKAKLMDADAKNMDVKEVYQVLITETQKETLLNKQSNVHEVANDSDDEQEESEVAAMAKQNKKQSKNKKKHKKKGNPNNVQADESNGGQEVIMKQAGAEASSNDGWKKRAPPNRSTDSSNSNRREGGGKDGLVCGYCGIPRHCTLKCWKRLEAMGEKPGSSAVHTEQSAPPMSGKSPWSGN